ARPLGRQASRHHRRIRLPLPVMPAPASALGHRLTASRRATRRRRASPRRTPGGSGRPGPASPPNTAGREEKADKPSAAAAPAARRLSDARRPADGGGDLATQTERFFGDDPQRPLKTKRFWKRGIDRKA